MPVKAYLEEEFEGWFADPGSFASIAKARQSKAGKAADNEVQILEEHEDPEPILDGKIDLGDLTAQYLSLSLDPYPKAPGAVWAEGEGPEESSTLRKNPFAVRFRIGFHKRTRIRRSSMPRFNLQTCCPWMSLPCLMSTIRCACASRCAF